MSGLHKIFYRYTAFLKSPAPSASFTPSPDLLSAWDKDGLHLKALAFGNGPEKNRVQMICESQPDLTPVFVAQRLKGRLDYFLRTEDMDHSGFHRSFYLGTLGQNDRNIVKRYIREQVNRSDLVDPLYRQRLNEMRFEMEPGAAPKGKHLGIHDHTLHVVLVVADRFRLRTHQTKQVAEALIEGSRMKGVALLELSLMPDHVHLLVRQDHHRSSLETLEDLKQGAGEVMRYFGMWQNGGYSGSVGPYPMRIGLRRSQEQGGWVR